MLKVGIAIIMITELILTKGKWNKSPVMRILSGLIFLAFSAFIYIDSTRINSFFNDSSESYKWIMLIMMGLMGAFSVINGLIMIIRGTEEIRIKIEKVYRLNRRRRIERKPYIKFLCRL